MFTRSKSRRLFTTATAPTLAVRLPASGNSTHPTPAAMDHPSTRHAAIPERPLTSVDVAFVRQLSPHRQGAIAMDGVPAR